MRPPRVKIADLPITVSYGSGGECSRCYQRAKFDKKPLNTKPTHCRDCHRPMRRTVEALADAPGTVRHSGNGRCWGCARLMREYGLTFAQWNEMLIRQCGRCEVCNDPMTNKKGPVVDHNHRTGAVRALLCSRCNAAEGQLLSDPARARALADYMERTA